MTKSRHLFLKNYIKFFQEELITKILKKKMHFVIAKKKINKSI